jgi:hypothetical protein
MAGENVLGWLTLRTGDPIAARLADLVLFAVLFADGNRTRRAKCATPGFLKTQ